MKRFIITGVLCLLVGFSFGQKKAVTAAKNEIKGTKPNFTEARSLIKDALTHPETANDAETWYIAGQIENKQFDAERTKEILGQKPDEATMYNALEKILPYFVKAAELDRLPDEKGKIKTRFMKDIRSNIKVNRPFYVNAGLFAYEKNDYKKAYENFRIFSEIPAMNFFDDEKWIIADGDSSEVQIVYYAGLAASLIPDHQASIDMFKQIKDKNFNENEIYQRLAYAYDNINDTVSFQNTIKEGFIKFPGDEYYVLNLINMSINSGQSAEAISYLEKAIGQNPESAQLYDVLGQIHEIDKNSDQAIKNMAKAIELEPDNIEFLSHIGRVYFNLGVETRVLADETSDINQSKVIAKESQDFFGQAMPFFEKVFELDSTNQGAIYALRSIYYSLNMNDQYEKMEELYNE